MPFSPLTQQVGDLPPGERDSRGRNVACEHGQRQIQDDYQRVIALFDGLRYALPCGPGKREQRECETERYSDRLVLRTTAAAFEQNVQQRRSNHVAPFARLASRSCPPP